MEVDSGRLFQLNGNSTGIVSQSEIHTPFEMCSTPIWRPLVLIIIHKLCWQDCNIFDQLPTISKGPFFWECSCLPNKSKKSTFTYFFVEFTLRFGSPSLKIIPEGYSRWFLALKSPKNTIQRRKFTISIWSVF